MRTNRYHMFGSVSFWTSLFLYAFLFVFRFTRFPSLWQFHDGHPSGTQRGSFSTSPKHLSVSPSLSCHMWCIPFVLTPSTFLSYYTSHSAEPDIWHSLFSWSGNVLFNSFTTSYKNFKGKFFKVFIWPEGTKFFFDEVGRSRFPMFWTRNPLKLMSGFVRPRVSMIERFTLFFISFRENSLHGSCWLCTCRLSVGRPSRVC